MIVSGDLIATVSGGLFKTAYLATAPYESGRTTMLDLKIRASAFNLIAKVGKQVTFTLYPSAAYDPTDGETTKGSPTQYVKKVSPPSAYKEMYIDGEIIRKGDCRVILPAKDLEFTPEVGIEVTIDTVVWKIVGLKPVYSGEQVAAYTLQLRK